ncbi:uncharacterized protein N7459_003505 [Penicillium hispanicum]|uniref:uncharacterized protein n=1 Tax=Penicillium hispanicum TaxID=1080232 RepID=UPI0025401501|nr:uncharacterized protein N7459_003505 [Penicillium hispanicum]KAJ5587740.1 hypothetical protein N7459_003505 [Penicillium hispanicum]
MSLRKHAEVHQKPPITAQPPHMQGPTTKQRSNFLRRSKHRRTLSIAWSLDNMTFPLTQPRSRSAALASFALHLWTGLDPSWVRRIKVDAGADLRYLPTRASAGP